MPIHHGPLQGHRIYCSRECILWTVLDDITQLHMAMQIQRRGMRTAWGRPVGDLRLLWISGVWERMLLTGESLWVDLCGFPGLWFSQRTLLSQQVSGWVRGWSSMFISTGYASTSESIIMTDLSSTGYITIARLAGCIDYCQHCLPPYITHTSIHDSHRPLKTRTAPQLQR
jgi:hypothetical protein